jgi:hypothetical protein
MTQKNGKICVTLLISRAGVGVFFSEKGAVSNFFRKGGGKPRKFGNYALEEYKASCCNHYENDKYQHTSTLIKALNVN